MAITYQIVQLPGDGIGPEVMAEATKVLRAAATAFDVEIQLTDALIGGAAIDAHGVPLHPDTIEQCQGADGILLGAVGGPQWDGAGGAPRPEQGLLTLRKSLGLFANLRPVRVIPALVDASPIKPGILEGVDLLVVRELTGGVYFGRPSRQWRERRGRVAVDTLIYREHEIERVVRLACDLARGRKRRVASVDKANVLESSRLWRSVVNEVGSDYPDVEIDHVLVDAMAMHLVRRPSTFDVIVTENMFGDILTDEASVLAGSIGLLPSASVGSARKSEQERRLGLYEPIHGSAPDIMGTSQANPAGMILSTAMLLRTSVGRSDMATVIEQATERALNDGLRTADLAARGGKPVSTSAFGDAVVERLMDRE